MTGDPPRVHTLRSDGKTPRTSDCFTPRTMTGNDGAFKGPEYGAFVEGPYKSPDVWVGRIMWAVAIVLLVVAGTVLLRG